MAKTNAERQAAYRARHVQSVDGDGEQVNMVVAVSAKRALERLAACYSVTQRVILEHLLGQPDRAALDEAASLPTGEADYYKGRLCLALGVCPQASPQCPIRGATRLA